jgi:signal transduction histidine kinase
MDQDGNRAIAIIAHELRSPLMPILNAAMFLRTGPFEGTAVRRIAGVIDRQARMLCRLVDDLLEVSRSRSGHLAIQRGPTSMAAIVDMCVETVTPIVADYGHRLEVDVASESMELDADPFRLSQALKNLVLNAAQYSERGGIIRIRAERVLGEAVVQVKDQGFGIDAAQLESIFELYQRLGHIDTPRSSGGLGVGLYLARYVAQVHGGSLSAHSAGLGLGSTFTLRVPCHFPDNPATDALEEPSSRSLSFFTTS